MSDTLRIGSLGSPPRRRGGLGMMITVTEYLVTVGVHVSAQGIYLAVATGAILGLSASGLYDMTSPKAVEAKRAEELP